MALSLKILREMFPKDEPAFKPPFYVETDKDGEVRIYDADDDAFLTFCTHTQLPIDDDRALAAEVAYWEVEAGRLVTALNAAYPAPHPNMGVLKDIKAEAYQREAVPGPSATKDAIRGAALALSARLGAIERICRGAIKTPSPETNARGNGL